MGCLGWNKGDELNLRRLLKARKLLDLARRSGYLNDVAINAQPYSCVRSAIELLDLAIRTEKLEKNRDYGYNTPK